MAGVDEVGRGPLAGPVLAAAVVLPPDPTGLDELEDSKLLTAAAREAAAVAVRATAVAWALGAASVREIDRLNIRRATALAMRRALARLSLAPDHILVDGLPVPELDRGHDAIIDGDAVCLSIAAASVLAKVARDRLMERLAAHYPGYRWEANKGYGTREHIEAIKREGTTAHHRTSFEPVSQLTLW